MLDRILNADWTRPYVAITLVAALSLVYLMNLTSYEMEDRADPRWLQWARRTAYMLMAGALLWSLMLMSHGWQPGAPSVITSFGLAVGAMAKSAAIHLRIRREGSRRHHHQTVEIPRFLKRNV